MARARVRSVGSDDREFRNLPGCQGYDFLRLRYGLHDQGHAQILFQQMLARCEASGSLDIIRQAGNAKNDSVRGFFGAKPRAAGHTALAERACQPQNAGQGADTVLLFPRKLGK